MANKLVIVVSACLILLNTTACKIFNPATSKFISHPHHYALLLTPLIRKVHNDHWRISYRYGDDCPKEKRNNAEELKMAITKALELWLQPLRELKTAQTIVSDFRYTENADLASSDTRLTFSCLPGNSTAYLNNKRPPDILLNHDTVDEALMASLAHELGHAFGMADTYVGRNETLNEGQIVTSTGGLTRTVGTQPASVMSSSRILPSEDDKRGIVWLYKHVHEGLKTEDCFFPDYVYEQDPAGCRPKYPLIFEAKHGLPMYAIQMLNEDPNIDVNAQNAGGLTALHYAVMYEKTSVVKKLLAHQDIKPFLRDKQGRSALDIARTANLIEIIALLEPLAAPRTVEDVNDDGVVNILDLVFVASNFEKSGKNRADVDGNGIVNILDLVRVASAFGDNEAAAPLRPEMARSLPAVNLSQWLVAAQRQASASPSYQRGLRVLEQLQAHANPMRTQLLTNYPNPFSRETWLPYRLAKTAQVTMSIHAADGRLVRRMALGSLPAGVYQDKSRAAHWDGRNAQGEAVASGVYFYTLSAGDFSATRKMMLRK